jgi:hypothetical protein
LSTIADRLAGIRARIDAAARSAGRNPSSIRLVAVSKTFPIDAVREAYAAGQREFGENRVQEALQKMGDSADLDIRWHLLGHLQTNKARKAGPAFATIHSIDSLELLQKIDAAAAEAGRAIWPARRRSSAHRPARCLDCSRRRRRAAPRTSPG